MSRIMPTTPTQPVLTVTSPSANATVGNKPFQIIGQVTDRGMPEPIIIDSVTVQVDGGPLIQATRKIIPNKTLTQVSFTATAQITGGNDPHTVTVVATNDQNQHTTKTITVFAGAVFQSDVPAILIDLRSLFPINPVDPQIAKFITNIQNQLLSLSGALSSIGKILIGPNIISTPVAGTVESQTRVGFWIEDKGFPVVPPSSTSPLPTLSAAAAADSFKKVPFLQVPNPVPFPTFAISIPVTTLQHLLDTAAPSIKDSASSQHLTVDTITVKTSAPATVATSISGHLPADVPLSVTISETVGLKAPAYGPASQLVPAVISTNSTSSVGSLLDWIIGVLVPEIGAVLAYIFYKVSVGAGQQSGLAGAFLGSIPPNIPFGNKDITLPPGTPFTLPDFPTLTFFWNNFTADTTGLFGSGATEIDARDQSIVKLLLSGPDFFQGTQATIQEFTDPVMGFSLQNIIPDAATFGYQITGTGKASGKITPPSPAVQAGDFNPHFPLPLKVSIGDNPFTLTVTGTETCQSDSTKKLTGTASKAVHFKVSKGGPAQ
jgi:hypothetical protein